MVSQRARVALLGLSLEAALVATQPEDEGDDQKGRGNPERDVHRPPDLPQRASGVVETDRIDPGPDYAPAGVEGKEPPVGHPVGSGQEGGVGTEDRDKAAKEDHATTVAIEHQAPDLQPGL